MRCRQCTPVPEEVRRAAGLLEGRWTVSILWASVEGASRFNEFKQAVGEIPPRTLAQRLLELEDAGLRQLLEPGGERRGRHRPEHLAELVEARGARPGRVDDRERVPPPEEIGGAADLLGHWLAAAAAHVGSRLRSAFR